MEKLKIKILIADDTLIAREGLELILSSTNDLEVVGIADTAHQAILMTVDLSPDILLMDMKWYGDEMAGLSAIEEIRRKNSKVKIIAITAYERLIMEARKAGADAAITKTFSRDELIKLIRQLFSGAVELNPQSISNAPFNLTSRELEIITLLGVGHTDKEISKMLNIASITTKNHIKNILFKLSAKNRMDAVYIARDKGLIP